MTEAATPRRGLPGRRPADSGVAVLPAALTVILVVACSWPLSSIGVGVDLDWSWKVALHMAVHERLDPGTQVVFTYGPLGFLSQPLLAYPWTARLSFLAYGLTQVALATVVVLGLRRTFGSLPVAAVGGFLAVSVIDVDPLSVVGFGLACAALSASSTPGRRAVVLSALLGALGGYAVLVKLNLGAVVVVLGVVVLVAGAAPYRTRALAWALGLVGASAVGWIAVGGTPGAVPDYLVRSFAVVSGYSDAMGYPDPGRPWQVWAVAAVAAAGAVAVLLGVRVQGRRFTAGVLVLWLLFSFAAFKAGFVRQEPGHVVITFAALLGGLCALPVRRAGVLLVPVLLAGTFAAALITVSRPPQTVVRPVTQLRAAIDEVRVLADRREIAGRIAKLKVGVAAGYGMDTGTFEAVRDFGVHVDPAFAGVVWANNLRWDPLPVFQTYVAYTASLDELNTTDLSGPGAPARIARHGENGTIDQRNPDWDSPAAMRAMLCHYRALSTAPGWQALGRVANRCGTPRMVSSVTARWGQTVTIPAAPSGAYTWVTVNGADVGGGEALRSLLLRADPQSVTLDRGRSFRVVPGTLAEGLILSVPRSADFTGEFALDQDARTLAVSRQGGASGTVRLRFYAASITP